MTTEPSRRVWSDLAIHPGDTISEEIEARQLDIDSVAMQLAVEPRKLRRVLAGKAHVSADLALGLERILGIEATFWMNLQTAYDLTLARRKLLTSVS